MHAVVETNLSQTYAITISLSAQGPRSSIWRIPRSPPNPLSGAKVYPASSTQLLQPEQDNVTQEKSAERESPALHCAIRPPPDCPSRFLLSCTRPPCKTLPRVSKIRMEAIRYEYIAERSSGRQGRRPNIRSYRSVDTGPLPLVAEEHGSQRVTARR